MLSIVNAKRTKKNIIGFILNRLQGLDSDHALNFIN